MEEELTEEHKRILKMNPEYFQPKVIGGVLCALRGYATTVGLVINLDEWCIERRYCYQDPADAILALMEYTDVQQHPTRNWIKVKGAKNGQHIDEFNPDWLNDKGEKFDHNKPPPPY